MREIRNTNRKKESLLKRTILCTRQEQLNLNWNIEIELTENGVLYLLYFLKARLFQRNPFSSYEMGFQIVNDFSCFDDEVDQTYKG